MDVLNPAVRSGPSVEEELAGLRAQVARLEAERAALWWAACHDELTGLANRRLFCTLAPRLLRAGRPAAVTVLDLNGFKPINDQLGHEVGDRVLRILAGRMAACTSHTVVARLGGDEFATVIASPRHEVRPLWWGPAVAALAAAIAEPMWVAGHLLNVTASVGVAPGCDEVVITELLRRADVAMYQAKANGRRYAVWDRSVEPRDLEASVSPRVVEIALTGTARDPGPDGAPTGTPYGRDPATVAPAATYQRHDPVWVYRDGAWRAGVVESASGGAVMATYRSAAGTGTMVDTMTAVYVVTRHTADPQLDRWTSRPMVAA